VSLFAPGSPTPGRPFWWDDGGPAPDLPSRAGERADVLVIGAGYTGLSAAIACADAGARTIVVDAHAPGEGASTRNGGMFGAHPRLPYETVVRRFGTDCARGIYSEARAAFDFTRGLIERERIDCDFEQTGRIQMAWTRSDFEAQKKLVAAITSVSDIRMEVVERDELSREIETRRYFGAIRFPDHAALHPRKFHDGLLSAALRRGVEVVRDCPVRGLRQSGGQFEVDTAGGRVMAGKVILATNGYTEGPFGWVRRRVFPVPSFLIATEELPADLLAELAPGKRMMVETRARHCYYRLSPDGRRILFGGRAALVPISPERAAARLHGAMTDIWPRLAGTRITHSWSGNTGYAFNHLPHVGVWEGVHYALGYSGSGVALAPYLGMKAAYQALGDPRGETAYGRTGLRASPVHPGGPPLFLRAVDLWYTHVVDRRQDAAAKRDGQPGSPS
jgi:glycine/D-amino acid oxidase-like deaminating enzyme